MSEIKFHWKADEIYHAESIISHQINTFEDNKNILDELKKNLNEILENNKIRSFIGNILLIKSQKKDLSGFASPFLNLININEVIFKEKDDLLWLILHENMHILEAEIISLINIQTNSKIKYFNNVVEKWLSNPLTLDIKINRKVIEIINSFVYDYRTFGVDTEANINFEMKYGYIDYDPRNLMLTYANLLKDNGKPYKFPNNDEGLIFLLESYIDCLEHWTTNLGDGDLFSMKGKIISTYLVSCTLHESLLEFYRKKSEPTRDFYQVLSDARVIYFSSILANREINEYEKLFPIDACKIFEAKRLEEKYGSKFTIENFIQSVNDERLSNEARSMAFRSYMGLG